MAEHLFIIQKEDEIMFQQASCSCNSELGNPFLPTSEIQTSSRFAEIVNAMLTAILIKNTDKSGLKTHDELKTIINEISFITQNLR